MRNPNLIELAAAFRDAQGEGLHDSDEQLHAALSTLWERGHAAWPEVSLGPTVFAGFLGERAPKDVAPMEWLNQAPAEDLFLACACLNGDAQALRGFDLAILSHLGLYLGRLRATPQLTAETREILLEKLFVGVGGEPPRIGQYTGKGPLKNWVRIAAVRTALTLLTVERAGPQSDEADTIANAIVPAGDPELDLLRATYQREFTSALRSAISGLSQRDRALLRFAFVEHMTPAQIGEMYGCHRTTAMRWMELACEATLKLTQRELMERLKISKSECDRLYALVKSQLDLNLDRLLASS